MAEVWKFPIPAPVDRSGRTELALPIGAEVLHVAAQDDRPCLWARIPDLGAPKALATFYVVGTGWELPRNARHHVGSFTMHGGSLVWHVFQP